MPRTLLVLSVIALCATGCGGSSQQREAEDAARKIEQGAQQLQEGAEKMAQSAQNSSEQMAEGLQQMAKGFQQMAQGSAKAVDFEQLKALLPSVDGWTMSEARGEQVNVPVAISRAEARYRRDSSQVDLEIMDTALSQLLLAPMSMFLGSGYSERSDDGFKRAATIGGQPGMEDWNTRSKRGEITTVVGNRFIVKATGHDVDSLDPVRQLVEAVDMGKLAAIK
jgi:X-X-X-Leu-X-X-Gly heptad repeat protein